MKQRIKTAKAIRELLNDDTYVIVVEHDLSVLDFMSDFVCILYGKPGHYGVVTYPSNVAEGINHFMDGFLPSENIRIRDTALTFNISEVDENEIKRFHTFTYPDMIKKQKNFELTVTGGSFSDSEIIVLLGENGTGKTTLIRLLAGQLQPDENGTVRELIMAKIRDAAVHPQFVSDVLKPLEIEEISDRQVLNLSGGEVQRVAIALCLGKPADVYLIDEPSAYLDAEQRINTAKVIKRFIRNSKKTAFIVEHDFIMAAYLADRVIVFDGVASVKTECSAPQSLLTGLNKFLQQLNITIRRDKNNFRPRINKLNGFKVN